MFTHHAAFELSRQRVIDAERRATLASRLGDLPKPAGLALFHREAKPLTCVVEVRRNSDKARIRRRLVELSAPQAQPHRKAS